MTTIFSLIFAVVLGGAYWLENDLVMGPGWFWWAGIVAAYLVLGVALSAWSHRFSVPIIAVCGVLMLAVIYFYDATMTIYLSGVLLLFAGLLARWLGSNDIGRNQAVAIVALIALSLMILPVPINRVTVSLPNLSAGTYLSVYATPDHKPGLDGRFFNRLDDHQELRAGLGTQIWFSQDHAAPLLRIDILREKIVLRILSITYETRVAYLDLPLFRLEGESLLQLKDSGLGQAFQHGMENDRLLIENLSVDQPAWIQLPPMDNPALPAKDHAIIVLVRLLVWLMIALALIKWAPIGWRRDP